MHVVLKTKEAAFVRVVPADGDSTQIVSDLTHHSESLGLEPVHVCVQNESNLLSAPAHSLYFSNICGKIQHYDVCRVTREEVRPYINNISDAFGRFQCLYSRECSLRTSVSMTTTLFRGGASSTGIAEVIEHAILPETVMKTTVHMLVAGFRLGYPVLMHQNYFICKMQQGSLWLCVENISDNEMSQCLSLRLSTFDQEWMSSFNLAPDKTPTACLINVSRTGTVNFFLSVPAVPFHVGVEDMYTPFLEAMIQFIRRYT